jgi:hypothetical protein
MFTTKKTNKPIYTTKIIKKPWVVMEVQTEVQDPPTKLSDTQPIVIPDTQPLPVLLRRPLNEVVNELSRENGWTTCKFVNDGKWTFEPLTNSTIIPPEGRHRMKFLEEEEVQVEYIVAHEKPYEPMPRFTQDETNKILLITGAVVLFLAFAWLIVLALPLLMMLAIVSVGCMSGDPVLVAHGYNEKGEEVWISLYRWFS